MVRPLNRNITYFMVVQESSTVIVSFLSPFHAPRNEISFLGRCSWSMSWTIALADKTQMRWRAVYLRKRQMPVAVILGAPQQLNDTVNVFKRSVVVGLSGVIVKISILCTLRSLKVPHKWFRW